MSTRLADDCFALPPGVDWTPVDDALGLLRDRLTCVCAAVDGPLEVGAVLAEPVLARRDNPPADNAAVDGFAFAWENAAAEADLGLADGRAAAGHPFPGHVLTGEALRILTGAELPAGADTVVLEEDCTVSAGRVRFPRPKRKGANRRAKGEDARVGGLALEGGTVLGPQHIARAAIVGVHRARVRERLRVGVLSTGDELITPGDDGPGIPDANWPMLEGFCGRQGYRPLHLGRAPDQVDAVRDALDRGAATADAILTTGGASAGDEDHVSRLLREEGQLHTWRIAVKPGRPLVLGLWRGVPVFGLPGNPVAAFVCALIFVRPALRVLAGAPWDDPQGFTVPAAFEKSKKPGRREFLRARLDGQGRAEIFRSEGSGLVGGLAWATGLVELPDGALTVRPGDKVRYLPYASFGL